MSLRLLSVQSLLVIAMLAVAPAQETAARADAESAPAALLSTRTLAKDYPVITVDKPCMKAGKTATCTTVITRAEFEELVDAINPRMIKIERRQLADNYGKMLALENEALRKGLDKTPEMQALLRYVRASALGGGAFRQVQREVAKNDPEEVEKYYKENQASYDRYTLKRIFIPLTKQSREAKSLETVADHDDLSASAKEMKALAETMQARAAAGEDFARLQKEIFQQAGIQGDPAVDFSDMMRGALPREHAEVFDLAAGATSRVIKDGSGYYVYKVISRSAPALDAIREQVAIEMGSKRSEAALRKIETVKVNENYFEKYDPPAPDPNEPEVDDD